jgi:hypothetical protein
METLNTLLQTPQSMVFSALMLSGRSFEHRIEWW